MSDAIKICGAMIAAAILLIVQRNVDSKNSFLIPIAAVVICFVFVISAIKEPLEYVKNLSSNGKSDTVSTVLKVCGISFVGEISHLICSEASETLVKCVNLSVGVAILVTVMPQFKSLVSYAVGLIP